MVNLQISSLLLTLIACHFLVNGQEVPLFRFTEDNYNVPEGSYALPAIELFSDTVLKFPIELIVEDIPNRGNATDGVDYFVVQETVRFPTGSGRGSQVSFKVPINDDDELEGPEYFTLTVTVSDPDEPGEVPPESQNGRPQASVTISDRQ